MQMSSRSRFHGPDLPCPGDINLIMSLIQQHLCYLYLELERFGLHRFTINSLFRFIVTFVVKNYPFYPGTPAQRTTALLNALKAQYPWIFFMLMALGVPMERANEIVRIVIAFALATILPVPLPPEEIPPEEIPPEEFPPEEEQPPVEIPPEEIPPTTDLEQEVSRILGIIEADTNILPTLEDLGVPVSRVPEIVRTVILFTLRNVDLTQPPTNPEQLATELYEQFRLTNPGLIRELVNYGVPNNQIRTILREIILITLNNFTPIPQHPDLIQQEVLRITDLIVDETNIYTDLEGFGIPHNRIIEIIRSVVLFTLRSINLNNPPTNVETEATRILRNLRTSDPELIANLRNHGIPQSQINAILRGIILYTLGAISQG